MKKLLILITLLGILSLWAEDGKKTVIKIKCIPGLKYDIKTFYIQPGAEVELQVFNDDLMLHNLVLVKPGTRAAVIEAASSLGVEGSRKNYIPDSKDVLWAMPVIEQKKSRTLKFTAPRKKGVYPYVCTYPGHGFVMFGSMVVSDQVKKPVMNTDKITAHANGCVCCTGLLKIPSVRRLFLPETGPASIAVALPSKYSYCWDTAACRLRYVWQGGFINNLAQHPAQVPKKAAELEGKIIFSASESFPLRFSASATFPHTKFLGYRLDKEGFPEFHYRVDHVEVRERLEVKGGVLHRHFKISGSERMSFSFANELAERISSSGKKKVGAFLFDEKQSRQFTIALKL